MSLAGFFNPQSAAMVGATEDLAKFGGRCFKRMIEFGTPRPLYPVNPKYQSVFDKPCYKSLKDLPERPGHVGIVVPAAHVQGVIEECVSLGVPYATVFTSGFREVDAERGMEMENTIRKLAREGGMRIMGPNCNGFVSFVHGFSMTTTAALSEPDLVAGNIGIVAQSGGLSQINVMYRAIESGLGISHQVACGNQADLDVLDFVQFMVDDPHTDVILMAVESIGDGSRLAAVAASAIDHKKPIIVLKIGRTEDGRHAAASHTGAMTGSDAVHDAAFRQYGMIRVDDCFQLNQMAMLLRQRRIPRRRGVAAVAASGGHAALLADLGAAHHVQWPPFGKATIERLNALLPAFGTPRNPIDLTTAATGNPKTFSQALQAIAEDEAVDVVVPVFTANSKREIMAGVDLVEATEKPAAILWTGKCSDDPELTSRVLARRGIPVFRDVLPCVAAIDASMRFGEHMRSRAAAEKASGSPAGAKTLENVRTVLARQGSRILGEQASREVLAAYGFDALSGTIARNVGQAVEAAERMGYPVVLKVESPDIQHKTEAGGVKLNLTGADAVCAAYKDIVESVGAHKAGARIDGILVQKMQPRGIELLVGIVRDATFGPVVSVGIGGIHVEVLRDLRHGIPPFDSRQAETMLRELRGYRLLEGVRGSPPSDVSAVIDVLVRMSWFANEMRHDISELDVNPLLVLPQGQGVRFLDALIVRT